MPSQHELRINLSGIEGDDRAREAAAQKAKGTEVSPPGAARSGSGTFLTSLEQDILNSSRRRGRHQRLSKHTDESHSQRPGQEVFLPAITTPRHGSAPPNEMDTVPAKAEKSRVQLPDPANDMEPENVIPLMREVVRRYYFRQVEEKPMAFLQHYDVVLPGHDRSEKLIGGHVQCNDSDLMRFYYCDFLQVPPFEGEMPFEEGAEIDVDTCMKWIQQFHPRTRMDAYPLFLLLKGVMKRLIAKEFEISSHKTRELKLEVSSLKDDRLELVRTVARTRTELGKQLADTSEKLAEVEQNLHRERAKKAKLHVRVEILGKQLEVMTRDRDEITTKLDQLQGQHDFELFKKNLAKQKAESPVIALLRTEDSIDEFSFRRTSSAGSAYSALSEGGSDVVRDGKSHNPGFKDPSQSISKDAQELTPRQRKCAGLIQSLNMSERIEMLNRLVVQPMVLAKIDAKKLAWEASSESKDMIMKQIIEKMNEDNNGDVDGAFVMSRIKGTERSDEALEALHGVKRHLGQNEAATVAAKAMGSTPEERLALLRATVEQCKTEPGFWDSISEATNLSKTDMIKEVVGQDQVAKGEFRALMQEGTRKVRKDVTRKDVDAMEDAQISKAWAPSAIAAGYGRGHANMRQTSFAHRATPSLQFYERSRRRSLSGSPTDVPKGIDASRTGSSGSQGGSAAGTLGSESEAQPLMSTRTFLNKMDVSGQQSSTEPKPAVVEDKETQTDEEWPAPPPVTKHPSKKKLQDFLTPPAQQKEKQAKSPTKLSAAAALKHIATIVQAKMDQDKQSDLHKRQRQSMQECVRDFFTQRYGLASVAKQKLAELITTVLSEVSKKTKAHTRIRLFHVLMGLAQQSEGQGTSLDECNFMLSLIQELFPSWRYGSAFVKDFSQVQILLHLEVVEFTLDRLFSNKKYGGQVPQMLLAKIQNAAFETKEVKKQKPGEKKGARQKALETKEGDQLIDTDFVLEVCHFQYREMENQSITALMTMMSEVDVNDDGVLQFNEFSDLLLRIDPMFTSQDVLEMYHECVGDDDVVDKTELMSLITERGLRFAVYNRAVAAPSEI